MPNRAAGAKCERWNGTRCSLGDQVVLSAPRTGGFSSGVNVVRSHWGVYTGEGAT